MLPRGTVKSNIKPNKKIYNIMYKQVIIPDGRYGERLMPSEHCPIEYSAK